MLTLMPSRMSGSLINEWVNYMPKRNSQNWSFSKISACIYWEKKRSILDIKKVLLIWYRDSGKDQQASFLSLPRNPEHF